MEIRLSCDDGHVSDMKVAQIWDKYGLKGTFYIAPYNKRVRLLSFRQIKQISEKHDIGGHTLNHALLTKMQKDDAFLEVYEGKKELESIIGKEITSFAPPKGWYNEETKQIVKNAGFTEMRTMKQGVVNIENYDQFEIPISVHFHPEHKYKFLQVFNTAKDIDGYFHLTVHSWELDRFNLWEEYENTIKFIRDEN